jgi:thioredoxin reductase
MHVGRHALQLSLSVTIYTNGFVEAAEKLETAVASTPQMKVNSRAISKLAKGPIDSEIIIHFTDGSEKKEAFMGAAPKMKQSAPFAEQLGLELNPVPFMQTAVKGVFAAGDCGSPMKIIGNALSTGAAVGAGASGQILAEEFGHEPLF